MPSGRFRPAPGKDFEGSVRVWVKVINAVRRRATSATRDAIALVSLGVIVVALGASALLWFVNGSFEPLRVVWLGVSPYLGYIFAAYMSAGRGRNDGDR